MTTMQQPGPTDPFVALLKRGGVAAWIFSLVVTSVLTFFLMLLASLALSAFEHSLGDRLFSLMGILFVGAIALGIMAYWAGRKRKLELRMFLICLVVSHIGLLIFLFISLATCEWK
ncbi:MAG: hypothetical protein HN909_03270 [Phycisphaerales bacterium]|mgnify:CR=1 FL=1|jgi:hypothetical protein|nr:hypothetical protein [Phycisphaerales bacterium]MBT7170772.1 hypothetical protein [Phycisphaerales bacterium]